MTITPTTVEMYNRLEAAHEHGATHVVVEMDSGQAKLTVQDALLEFNKIAPGESFEVVSIHWERPILHFSGRDPSKPERESLESLYADYCDEPGDEGAARNYILALHRYAGISEA